MTSSPTTRKTTSSDVLRILARFPLTGSASMSTLVDAFVESSRFTSPVCLARRAPRRPKKGTCSCVDPQDLRSERVRIATTATLAVTLPMVMNMSTTRSSAMRIPIPCTGKPKDTYTGAIIIRPPLGMPGE